MTVESSNSPERQSVDRGTVDEWIAVARGVLEAEAQAISNVARRLDSTLAIAVKLILEHKGKVIVSGIGKSGHIGQKIVSTLCSTGTQAVFLHAVEAVHGDLGVYTPGDPTILISKSGSTAELLRLVPLLRQFQSPLLGIVGNMQSPLAQQVDVVLDATVTREADHLNLAPTTSSTVALALGDALAVTLMQARLFTDRDFARYHPAGQLGRNLSLQVADVMHRDNQVAWVGADAPIREVIVGMTEHPLGAACVVDKDTKLLGLITDGDLRRALYANEDFTPLRAADVMTRNPVTVVPEASLREAIQLMEDRSSQISVLAVIDSVTERCLGVVRIHDIYQPDLV